MHISVHTHSHTVREFSECSLVQHCIGSTCLLHQHYALSLFSATAVAVSCNDADGLEERGRFELGASHSLFKTKNHNQYPAVRPPNAIDRLKVLLLCFAGAPRCPACAPWTSAVLLSHSQKPASYRLEQIVHRWHWAEMTSAMKIFHYKPCVSLSHTHTHTHTHDGQQPRVDIKQAYFGYQSRLMGWKNIWVLLYSPLLPHAQPEIFQTIL